MQRIVDFHIHSHYSRATSKDMNIASLYKWGKKKGIEIMGTGDFTHPAWFAEMQEKLEPAEPGLFTLKKTFSNDEDAQLSGILRKQDMRFFLSVEISNIYSRGGTVRKLHNVVIMKSFATVAKFNARLDQIGNISADGRPILGLDSEELLKIALDCDPEAVFIPAHIWTPWFALFGSKSGFDTVKEAFGEYAKYIHAVETGLSSDPAMNWRLSQLDRMTLVSNSDAHSPAKLGREANLIDSELTYDAIMGAINTGDNRFIGTIEFYPEEGKYHYDGHRVCNVCFTPAESLKLNNICPVCGKPLVLGVDHRVEALADRPVGYKPKHPKTVEYIVPLPEILAQLHGVKSPNSIKVKQDYEKLLANFGNEFHILRTVPITEFKTAGHQRLATAIERMRTGQVSRQAGYDGVFGIITVTPPDNELDSVGQMSLGI